MDPTPHEFDDHGGLGMGSAEPGAQPSMMIAAASGFADGRPVTSLAPDPEAAGRPRSGASSNSTSFTAIAVVALYLVIAASTGIVLLGVLPVMLSVRAFQRGEKLAPVALAGAAIAVLVALSGLAHH